MTGINNAKRMQLLRSVFLAVIRALLPDVVVEVGEEVLVVGAFVRLEVDVGGVGSLDEV